ncbi:MAG: hypothetical protein NUW08_02980, partial [Candidatus Uhrbacteria bacterium]|nr:hypothetical protein [Candidatus Uhrbacteria bacterium]
GASSGQGPLPSGVGGALKTFLIILVIIVAVVAIGGGLFWFFVLRTPAETGIPNEIPTVKTSGSPIPTDTIPTPTQPVIPAPVTEPPDGVNIPPPTSVMDTPPVEPEPEIDTDGDGLNDRRETELGLNPNNPDTDGDGLNDGEEVLTYGTNPSLQDTDTDGFSDAEEIRNGYNPLGAGQCANPDCRP